MFRFISFLFLVLPLNQALATGWGKVAAKKRRGWIFLDGPVMARFLDGLDTGYISAVLRNLLSDGSNHRFGNTSTGWR